MSYSSTLQKLIIIILFVLLFLSQSCSKSSTDNSSVDNQINTPDLPDEVDEKIEGEKVEDEKIEDDDEFITLPIVSDTAAVLQNGRVLVSWSTIVETENLKGYLVYRTQLKTGNVEKLTQNAIDETRYLDSQVTNGSAYRYSVTTLDINGKESEKGIPAEIFVAYNNTAISNLRVERQGADVRLDWDRNLKSRYRIFRSEEQGSFQSLADIDNNRYLDKSAVWDKQYNYKATTLITFTNSLNGQTFDLQGPDSTVIKIVSLPALEMTIVDTVDSNGRITLVVDSPTGMTMSGTYEKAIGSVKITAVNAAETVSTTSSSGKFQLFLPENNNTKWTITVSEQTIANRTVSQELNLLKDKTPPTIVIDGETSVSINADFFTLAGTVTDNFASGLQLNSLSDRYAGQTFGVIQSTNNRFYSEVPLKSGINNLSIIAVDASGNTSQVNLTVSRLIPLAPSISITKPTNGNIVRSDSLTIEGLVYSSQLAEKLRLTFGIEQQFPEKTSTEGIYTFSFSSTSLKEGINTLSVFVQSPIGSAQANTTVTYQLKDSKPENVRAPVINITNPKLNNATNATSIIAAGNVSSDIGLSSITLNGQSLSLNSVDGRSVQFRERVDLSNINTDTFELVFVATDTQGNSSTKTVNLLLDNIAPVITLTTNNIQPAPSINQVIETPFLLQGFIAENNLAGFSINNQPVGVLPNANNDYNFSANLGLIENTENKINLTAWDKAGNSTETQLILNSVIPVKIEIIEPLDNSELIVTGNSFSLDIVARINGFTVDQSVNVIVDDGIAVNLSSDESVFTGSVPVNASDGEHKILIQVRDASGELVAATSTIIDVVNSDNVTVSIMKTSPENNQMGVEPNAFIALYFNKTIDVSLLQVIVKETVHGKTYDLSGQAGKDPLTINNPFKLVDVNYDLATVTGGISRFPSNKMIAFYPEKDLVYGAKLFIEVIYDSKTLSRFNFTVRPLPTFVEGLVTDNFMQPVSGLTISLPDLKRTVITDQEGMFTFGFGDATSEALTSGRQSIVFNPDNKTAAFSSLERWINIDRGRFTQLGQFIVPVLNKRVPYRQITSGQTNTTFASGELLLDLSEAQLLFPDGQDKGDVHVQLLPTQQISVGTQPGAYPYWIYAIQPSGIAVSGLKRIEISMPALNGSYDYIPLDGSLALLVGYDQTKKQIVPIGVGRVTNRKVVSEGELHVTSLDYFGYVLTLANAQNVMKKYVDNLVGFQELLMELNGLRNSNEPIE